MRRLSGALVCRSFYIFLGFLSPLYVTEPGLVNTSSSSVLSESTEFQQGWSCREEAT